MGIRVNLLKSISAADLSATNLSTDGAANGNAALCPCKPGGGNRLLFRHDLCLRHSGSRLAGVSDFSVCIQEREQKAFCESDADVADNRTFVERGGVFRMPLVGRYAYRLHKRRVWRSVWRFEGAIRAVQPISKRRFYTADQLKGGYIMAYCGKCGTKIEDDVKFCPSCGASTEIPTMDATTDFGARVQSLNNTADTTTAFNNADIEQNKVMAILSYLSFLVLVPLFAVKNSPFARYHTNQGLVLFIVEVIIGVIYNVLRWILPYGLLWRTVGWIYSLCSLGFLVLTVIGIINVVNGRKKKLPIIGDIKLIK